MESAVFLLTVDACLVAEEEPTSAPILLVISSGLVGSSIMRLVLLDK